MDKIVFSVAFLIISNTGYAQKENGHKQDNVTAYEYGMPLTNCESNFENLFNNWSKFVTNNQQTKLISYKYVDVLRDSSQITHYAKLLNNWKSLTARVKTSKGKFKEIIGEKGHGDSTVVYTREFYFYPKTWEQVPEEYDIDSSQKYMYRAELEMGFKIKRDYFKNKVQIGDKVYAIKLEIEEKKYDHYVICRPKEHEIVYDNLLLKVDGQKYILDKIFPSE